MRLRNVFKQESRWYNSHMNLSVKEVETLQYYDQYAEQYASKHNDFKWNNELALLKTYISSGRLLEVGSGGGRDAKYLIRAGYDYIGIDGSKGLIKAARKNNPDVRFLNKNIYNLDFKEHSFDCFWAVAVLLHIPKSRIAEALGNIHRVIRPDGIGVIVIKQGKGEHVEESPDGNRRHFTYYSNNQFKKILEENNFKVISNKTRKKNEKTTWIKYIAKVIK